MSSTLGGNSKQSSTTNTDISNRAYEGLAQGLGGVVPQTQRSGNFISALLGLGGDENAANKAFQDYQDSSGYQWQLGQGTQAITNNAATKGMLNSGSTLKAVNQYGQGLASQSFNNYLSNLLNLGNQGIQAGQVISGAGGTTNTDSTSKGSSKQGLGL